MPKSVNKHEIIKGFAARFTKLTKVNDPGLSNAELGKVFGVSSTTIFKWKNAQVMPDMANAGLIATRYNVTVDWLLTGRKQAVPVIFKELEKTINSLTPENYARVLEAAKAYQALERQKDSE